MGLIDNPGISIIGIDPGSTTGVAVWDAYDGRVYVDQIDAGRGRWYKQRIHGIAGHESPVRERAVKRRVGGRSNELKVLDVIESGTAALLMDMILAAGPRTVVVIEDFILGYGGGDAVRSSDRAGLSPVRIRQRLRQKCEDGGVLNGDAWRQWGGMFLIGVDERGLHVEGSGVPDYRQRLTAAEQWRFGGVESFAGRWAGGGVKWVDRLPGTRFYVGGDRGLSVAEVKRLDLWKAGLPHAMDALLHLLSWGVKAGINVGILGRPERIWASGAIMDGKGLSAKSVKSAR